MILCLLHCLLCFSLPFYSSGHSSKNSAWIGIASAPDHAEKRIAIRQTWLQDPWVKACTVRFVVGRSGSINTDIAVHAEQARYGDLLLVNISDTYHGLIRKTKLLLQAGVASGSQWVLKIDDDVMPRMQPISGILHEAEKHGGEPLQYFGHFWNNTRPDRNPEHTKWFVSPEVFPGGTFPKYANGPLYAMSGSLAQHVVDELQWRFLKGVPIVPLEDVSVGMAVASLDVGQALSQKRRSAHQRVRYVELELGTMKSGIVNKAVVNGCMPSAWSMYYHGIPPDDMRCMWKRLLQNKSDICCDSSREWKRMIDKLDSLMPSTAFSQKLRGNRAVLALPTEMYNLVPGDDVRRRLDSSQQISRSQE